MATVYRIPLLNRPQKLTVPIGSTSYKLETYYAAACNGEGGWYFNLSTQLGVRMLSGIPFVTGQDLLEPFTNFGFDAELWIGTAGDKDATPTETNLGQVGGSNLYYSAPSTPIVIPDASTIATVIPDVAPTVVGSTTTTTTAPGGTGSTGLTSPPLITQG